jgi:hypothetical protein
MPSLATHHAHARAIDPLYGVVIETVDYAGRVFDRFHARRDSSTGTGWYVFGRNPGYGDNLIKLCARPDVPCRRHPHYNNPVQRGFRTRAEAQIVADAMNEQRL